MDTATPQPAPVIDASKYIRTYAKDVAAITGKSPVLPKGRSKKGREIPAETTPRRLDLSATSEDPKKSDLSILERQVEAHDDDGIERSLAELAKQDTDAPIDLPTISSDMIVGGVDTASVDAMHPHELTPPTAAQPAPDANREDVLSRLRANANAAATQKPTPTAVIFTAPPQVLPPITLPTAPLPQPSSLTAIERSVIDTPGNEPAPIHTYKTDFADEIDKKGANTFSVLAAEGNARPQKVVPQKWRVPIGLIVGIGLVIIGIGAAGAGYYVLQSRAPVSILPAPASLIAPDSRISLATTNEALLPAFAALTNNPIPANSVEQVLLPATATTSDVTSNVLSILSIPAPDILIRNTDPSSMTGIVNDGTQTKPFFVLRVTSYERTFAGMLQWEASMPSDLGVLYPAYPQPTQDAAGTTTASAPTSAQEPGFVDEVVVSHNARAYKDSSGNTVFIYGYADSQTLIIARDEDAFALLLQRLQTFNQ